MRKGNILIAIDPSIMDDGKPSLTVGKPYEIKSSVVFNERIEIIDDDGDPHEFSGSDDARISKFFVTEEQYLILNKIFEDQRNSQFKGTNDNNIEHEQLTL